MSEHDDIRRALEELSSHPPHRDRKPAVRERVAVVRRRRRFGSGVAISVVTLMASIAVTSLGGGGAAQNANLLVTPSVPQTPVPSPAPSPRSSAPAAAAIAKAPPVLSVRVPATAASGPRNVAPGQSTAGSAQAPASVPGSAAKVTNPATPQSTVTVYLPESSASKASSASQPNATASKSPTLSGAGSASGTASTTPATLETLNADIAASTVEDGSVAPETVVTVRVHGAIIGSLANVVAFYTTVHRADYSDTQARGCTVQDGKLHDVDETFTFRTRYRAAGPQQVDAIVTTLDPTCAAGAAKQDWPFSGTISIPVGSALSNGVAPVTLSVTSTQVQDSTITLSVDADDADGYLYSFRTDWGVGTPDTIPGGNGANCSAGEGGGVFWPHGPGSGSFSSPVLPAGTYNVTVTATSTGCDGKDLQTAQQKLTVTVP
ncbi:MAG: hypothetical protein ABI912_10780 [Actinomycetota bacterium]